MDWKWFIAHTGMLAVQFMYAFFISTHFENLFSKKKKKSAFWFMFFLILFVGLLFSPK